MKRITLLITGGFLCGISLFQFTQKKDEVNINPASKQEVRELIQNPKLEHAMAKILHKELHAVESTIPIDNEIHSAVELLYTAGASQSATFLRNVLNADSPDALNKVIASFAETLTTPEVLAETLQSMETLNRNGEDDLAAVFVVALSQSSSADVQKQSQVAAKRQLASLLSAPSVDWTVVANNPELNDLVSDRMNRDRTLIKIALESPELDESERLAMVSRFSAIYTTHY